MKRAVEKINIFGLILIIATTAFAFKKELPKVFVVGDSISMHYGPYLEKGLANTFAYNRKRGSRHSDNPNGGDSSMVLSYLKELKEDSAFQTDYMLINCGLHDIKRYDDYTKTQVSLEQYSKNLSEIIAICKEMHVELIWINSTPVVDTIHNARKSEFHRLNKDLVKRNKIAKRIMKKNGVPVIDLYNFTKKYIPDAYIDHVHYTIEMREMQAEFIAGKLMDMVK